MAESEDQYILEEEDHCLINEAEDAATYFRIALNGHDPFLIELAERGADPETMQYETQMRLSYLAKLLLNRCQFARNDREIEAYHGPEYLYALQVFWRKHQDLLNIAATMVNVKEVTYLSTSI